MRAPNLCTYCGHLLTTPGDEARCPGCGRSAEGASWERTPASVEARRRLFRRELPSVVLFSLGLVALARMPPVMGWIAMLSACAAVWLLLVRGSKFPSLVYLGCCAVLACVVWFSPGMGGVFALFFGVVIVGAMFDLPRAVWQFRSPDGRWAGTAQTYGQRIQTASGSSADGLLPVELGALAPALGALSSRAARAMDAQALLGAVREGTKRHNAFLRPDDALVLAVLMGLAARGAARFAARGAYRWARTGSAVPAATLGARGPLTLLVEVCEVDAAVNDPWLERAIMACLRERRRVATANAAGAAPYRVAAKLEEPELVMVAQVLREVVAPAPPQQRRAWLKQQLEATTPPAELSDEAREALLGALRAACAAHAREVLGLHRAIEQGLSKRVHPIPAPPAPPLPRAR